MVGIWTKYRQTDKPDRTDEQREIFELQQKSKSKLKVRHSRDR